MQVRLPLRRVMRKSSPETVSETLVVSFEGNADVFSLVCDSKIEIVEDIGIGAVEVHLVKILLESPNRWWGFDSSCTGGNEPRSISTDDGVCTTGASWIRKKIYCCLQTLG